MRDALWARSKKRILASSNDARQGRRKHVRAPRITRISLGAPDEVWDTELPPGSSVGQTFSVAAMSRSYPAASSCIALTTLLPGLRRHAIGLTLAAILAVPPGPTRAAAADG